MQVADGLAGRGHHAAHAVDLVAEELDAHGRGSLRGVDVDRVAVDVEGSRAVKLAGVGIAQAHEQGPHVLEGDLLAHGERGALPVARVLGRHAAQQRPGTRDHDAGLARGEATDGLAARADEGVVGGVGLPREVGAVGVAADHVHAEPRLQRLGCATRGFLARDHKEAGARVGRPDAREHERAGALGHGERDIAAGPEAPDGGLELGDGEQLA